MNRLKSILLRYRSKIIVWLSLLLISIAILNLYFAVEVNVRSNDECLWEPEKTGKDSVAIFFDFVKVDGVAWEAGIRDGDQLIEIDGKTITNTVQAQYILNEFDYGQYAEYKYMRDGEIFTTKVYVKKLVQFDWIANCLGALFWMLIGFIVLTSKPDGRIHRLFYLWGVVTVLSSLMVHLPIYGEYDKFYNQYGWSSYLIIFLWLIGMTFSPFVLNYFIWNFPAPFRFAEKKWVRRAVFLIPSAFFITFLTLFVLAFSGVLGRTFF